MDDNSIITKYELSEKEKKLKSNFFNNKVNKNDLNIINDENNNDNIMNNINKISSQITDEKINKFIEDNQNLLNNSANNNNNNNNTNEYNPTQLNLIYTQNKLIERNVDILQETQRSLHDFLIYNMRKDAQNKPSFNLNNLNEYLKPLYNNINDLKEQVKTLNNNNNLSKNLNNQTSNPNLNENLKEDNSYKHFNNLKNKNNINNIKPPLKSNKNINNKDKQVVKAISDLKTTMGNLSNEMNKLGNKFQEKLNKVMEDTEHNKLKNIIGVKNNNLNMSFGDNKKDSFIKGKFLDNIDYNELKNELNEINFEKESIVNDYEKNIPQMQKLQKPKEKEKIKFSYNLDYPTSVSSNKSQLNNTKSSVFSLDENQNVFNNNLENESKNVPLRTKKNLNQPFNSTNMSTNIPFNNNINNSNYISNQQPISNQSINKKNQINDDYSKLSVMDRMREYKNRMNNTKISIVNSHESKISNQPKNLNPFEENYINQDMGSNASKITLQNYNKPQPSNIENQLNEMNKHPPFKLGNFENVQPVVNRDEITMIGVQPNENIERKNIEDTLLRLCADKLVQKIPTNQTLFTLEQPIPQPSSIINLSPDEIERLKKERIENYIFNAIKNKDFKDVFQNKKLFEQKENDNIKNKNEICKIYEKEYISNTKQIENDKYDKLIESLNNKFGGIENALNNLGKNLHNQQPPQPQMFNNNNIPNINDISSKVMHRLKNDLGIDINLNRPNQTVQETKEKTVINKRTAPFNQKIIKKKYDGNNILDESNKIKIEDLDELIRMPHKINLKEYEISQTSSYVSESQIIDINNQNNININIHKNKNINLNEESEDDNSLSKGQIVNESMSVNDENKINKNRTGLDLLLLKNYNENLPNQINLMNNYKLKYENDIDDNSYKFNNINNQNKNINLNVFNVDNNNFNYNDKNIKINIQNNNMKDSEIKEESEDKKINININKNNNIDNNNNIKINTNINNNIINNNKNINLEVNESDNFFENSEEN